MQIEREQHSCQQTCTTFMTNVRDSLCSSSYVLIIVKLIQVTYYLTAVFSNAEYCISSSLFPSSYSWAARGQEGLSREALWDQQTEAEAGRESDITCQGMLLLVVLFENVNIPCASGHLGAITLNVFCLLLQRRYQLPLMTQQYKPTSYQWLKVCLHLHTCTHVWRVKEDSSTWTTAFSVLDLALWTEVGLTDILGWHLLHKISFHFLISNSYKNNY